MKPGEDCSTCHNFLIAGTVYPTEHEPNDCNGVDTTAGATVVITDANGMVLTLTVNAAGNFVWGGGGVTPGAPGLAPAALSLVPPYSASVKTAKGTRSMIAKQTKGNCNGCHTQNGTNGTPGRIVIP